LIPREAFRSFPERNERRTWKILSAEGHGGKSGRGGGRRGEEHCRPTNRRGLTDVATPYVTFIADAALLHLSSRPSRFTPPKWEKETILRSFYVFYHDGANRARLLLSLSTFAANTHSRFLGRKRRERERERRRPRWPLKISHEYLDLVDAPERRIFKNGSNSPSRVMVNSVPNKARIKRE